MPNYVLLVQGRRINCSSLSEAIKEKEQLERKQDVVVILQEDGRTVAEYKKGFLSGYKITRYLD